MLSKKIYLPCYSVDVHENNIDSLNARLRFSSSVDLADNKQFNVTAGQLH
jgi:hypothetical protein